MYELVCKNCNKNYTSRRQSEFCNHRCWRIFKYYGVPTPPPECKEVNCEYCNRPFMQTPWRRKFCNIKCDKNHAHTEWRKRNKVALPPKQCEYCFTEFTPIHKTQIFCSKDCNKKSWANKMADKQYGPLAEKECLVCKKSFLPLRRHQKLCSKACKDERRLANRRVDFPLMNCDWCGSEFKPKTSINHFCSSQCRLAHRAAHKEEPAQSSKQLVA